MQALGMPDLPAQALLDLRIHDVTPEFAEKMQQARPDITAAELIDTAVRGETA